MSSFKRAVRQRLQLRMALEGPSGSGKTITALRIAQGLGHRIAVIDTENRSASRYIGEDFGEGPIEFDVIELDSFEPGRLVKLLREAAEAGYDVVVVDSLSHFWMGEGGMLDAVDAAAKRNSGGNTFAAWKTVKPAERELWDALNRSPTNQICTLRTKSEWVIEENDRGKKTPRKIGLKAEQRDGLEYEFDAVGDVDADHVLTFSKTRCRSLDRKAFTMPGADVARILRNWLDSGEAAPPQEERRPREQRRDDEPRRDDRREPPRDDRRDDRPRQEPQQDDAAEARRKAVAAFAALSPPWSPAHIAEALGVRDVDKASPDDLRALYPRAKAGSVQRPGSTPSNAREPGEDMP